MTSPAFASLNSETIKRRLDFELDMTAEMVEGSMIPLLDDIFYAALWVAKVEDDDELSWTYYTEDDFYTVTYREKTFYAYC